MEPIVFTTKSGKILEIREPKNTPDEAQAALEFINALIAEDAMIAVHGNPTTYEEELEWLEKKTSKIERGEELSIWAYDGTRKVASVDVRRRDHRSKHVGNFGIAIAKEYRDQGLGTFLVELALREARERMGLSHAELAVLENNPAIHLYRKVGFKEIGRKPEAIRYKDKLIAEIIMWKKL